MKDRFIPLSVPNLKGNELKYVTKAVETEWVSTSGPYVEEFENKIADYVKAKGAVSCQNGTAGLHISLIINGITRDDEVIVPSLTFIAAVNPVKYMGAEPIFMDCDDSLTIDLVKLAEFCEKECEFKDGKLTNKKTSKHIKAIVIVHVFGNMADMESLMDIAKRYNLIVIEDATEAIGTYYTDGKYKGKYAGTMADIGVFSFNGNKIMTTGGGGMIVSNDKDLLKKAKHLTTQAKQDELYFIHDEIGYNYRMSNLQAALGIAQLESLEDFIKTKKQNYLFYKEYFEDVESVKILDFREDIRSNYWFYSLYLKKGCKLGRNKLIEYLSKENIQSRPIWALINEQVMYRKSQSYKIEKAKEYEQAVVNIPCSTNLSLEDAKYVADCIKKAIS